MSSKKRDSSGDVDLIDREKEKKKIRPPSKYKVVFLNDDYTPMDFVIIALCAIFHKSPQAAFDIMMNVHEKGRGIAGGPYSKEIAETKVSNVMQFAKQNGHPLKAIAEKD